MKSIGQWVERLANTTDRDGDGRPKAYRAVCDFTYDLGSEGRAWLPDLIALLRHPHANVRWAAAEGLYEVGPDAQEAVSALLATLEDQDEQVRVSAARALTRIAPADPTVIRAFLRHLTDRDPDLDFVGVLVEGLRDAGTASVRPLADCLASPDVELRRQAGYTLCQMGLDIAAVLPELAAAAHDPDSAVRMNVASALGELAGHPLAGEAVQCLIELLRDEAPVVRGRAVCSLGVLGAPARKALPVLEELAQQDGFCQEFANPQFMTWHVLKTLRISE